VNKQTQKEKDGGDPPSFSFCVNEETVPLFTLVRPYNE
jgi:hypothetical protein